MKASRSLIPGGWFCFGGQPPPSRGQHWLLLAATILLLVGRPAGGAEAVFPTRLEDHGGLSMDEFSSAAPVFHTKDAPSDARVLQRIRNSAGLRGIFSLTYSPDSGSVGPGDHRGVLITSAPQPFLPQLTQGQSSLAAFTVGAIGRHFEKLSTWSGQSGAGVIYPINSRVGLFVDAHRVTPYGARYYGVARAGLRILF